MSDRFRAGIIGAGFVGAVHAHAVRATGSVVVSQVSPGRKNRLWLSFDGTAASYAFDQELPDTPASPAGGLT